MARVSRFCVYWRLNTIRNVTTDATADGTSSHVFENAAKKPQRIQKTVSRIAVRNAHGEPTISGVLAAILRMTSIALPYPLRLASLLAGCAHGSAELRAVRERLARAA